MHVLDANCSNRARTLLETLPDSVYAALPSARTTSELCSNVVARAVQFRNPGIVSEWLDYELTRASGEMLMSVLETAIALEVDESGDQRAASIGSSIVTLARDRIAASECGPSLLRATSSVDAVVDGILATIGTFDDALYRHSMDVAGTAVRLATALCCPGDEQQLIWNAARTHEIGRIRVQKDIVTSARRLNDVERQGVRSVLGDVRGLRRAEGLRDVADVVEEVYLVGPMLASRAASIVKVADGFHSMCEARSYRPALAPHAALQEMARERGFVYNSGIVDALASMLGSVRPYAWSA